MSAQNLHPLVAALVEGAGEDSLPRAASHLRHWQKLGRSDCGEELTQSTQRLIEAAVISLNGEAHGKGWLTAKEAGELTAKHETRITVIESARNDHREMARKLLEQAVPKDADLDAELAASKAIVEALGHKGKKKLPKRLRPLAKGGNTRVMEGGLVPCPNCNSVRLPHANCPNCNSAPMIQTDERTDAQQYQQDGQTVDVIEAAPAAPAVAPSPGDALAAKAPGATGAGNYSEGLHPRGRGGKWIQKGAGMSPPGSGQPHPGDQAVVQLQQRLSQLGFQVDQNGQFGTTTEEAVKAFQTKYGIEPTGKVDEQTVEMMRNPPPQDAAAASMGLMGSSTVKQIKQSLNDLGYESNTPEAITNSLKMLQRQYGLAVTGQYGPDTADLIARLSRGHHVPGQVKGGGITADELTHATTEEPEEGVMPNERIEEASGVAVSGTAAQRMVGGKPEWTGVNLLSDPANRPAGVDDVLGNEPVRMPPNLRDADDKAFPRCNTCVHFNGKKLCALYSAGVSQNKLCDSWLTLSPPEQVNAALFYTGLIGQMPDSGVQEAASTRSAKIQLAMTRLREAVRETGGAELDAEIRRLGSRDSAIAVLFARRVDEAKRGMPGYDLAEASGSKKQRCAECGAVQAAGRAKCANCGHSLMQESVDGLLDKAIALDLFEAGSEDFDGAYWLTEADFSDEERQALAKKGHALPGGAYPIRNASDLKNAIQAFGRAKNPGRVKAWIMKRAKALKLTNLLPDTWGAATQEALYESAYALVEVKSDVYPNLERKPGKQNWVDYAGGLPDYIERIAKHIHYEHGHPIGQAIQFAVGTVRRWCAGGSVTKGGASKSNVSASTKAKACAAVAEWEAKKKSGGAAQKAANKTEEAALDPSVLAVMEAQAEIDALDLPAVEVSQEQALKWMEELEVHEAFHPLSIHFDPQLHPRDRRGEFSQVLSQIMKAKHGEATMPNGVRVARTPTGRLKVTQAGRHVGTFGDAEKAADAALGATGIPSPSAEHQYGIQGTRYATAFDPGQRALDAKGLVAHAFSGPSSVRTKNLSTSPGRTANTSTIHSYNEPIAHIDHGERRVYVNSHKYSSTTSTHRNMIESEAKSRGFAVQHIDRAEARSRAGMTTDEPFEKLPAGVKPADYTPKTGAWQKLDSFPGPGERHMRTLENGRKESLATNATGGYTHTSFASSGAVDKVKALSREEGEGLLSGKSLATTRAQTVAQDRHRRLENQRVSSEEKALDVYSTRDQHGLPALVVGKKLADGTYLEAEARLHKIGEQSPYFSVTGTHWKSERYAKGSRADRGMLTSGAIGDLIAKHIPELKPVVDMHLADESGVPMHAKANGFFWYGGASPNSPGSDFGRMTPHERAAQTLRVSPSELAQGLDKSSFDQYADSLVPRWKTEADQARSVLENFGSGGTKGGGDPREDSNGLLPGETWPQRKARYAKQFAESGKRTATFERPGQKTPPGSAEEFAKIEHAGQRVTILTPHGQERTGRTVMRGPAGWVLNLGGAHGTPGIAHEGNTVKVSKSRKLHEVAADVATAFPALRSTPGMVAMLKAEEAILVRLPVAELLVSHGSKMAPGLREELREELEAVAPVEDSKRRLQEAQEANERAKVKLYTTMLEALA